MCQLSLIDFRQNPTENTVPSLLLLGRVLNTEKRAAEFIDFYIQQVRKVSNIVQSFPNDEKPLVFVENAAGYETGFCCNTFGSYNYGRFVELAGARNFGSETFSGYSSEVSLEGIIASNPSAIVATGTNWYESIPGVTAVLLGYDANPENVKERLNSLKAREGFRGLQAVKDNKYSVIYHQFYNNPAHFIALQQLAKWLHPEEFSDLNPEATWKEFHDRFMPFKTSGIF